MMNWKFLLVFLFAFSSVHAQYVPEDEQVSSENTSARSDWKEKFFTGGGVGLQFGTITLLQASPILGYRVNKYLNIGIGGSYQYFKNNIYQYSTSIYGYNAFSQFHLGKGIVLHGEYNHINYKPYLNNERLGVDALLLGAGYNQALVGRSGLFILALWNVITTPLYPYQNPIIRGGIQVGL